MSLMRTMWCFFLNKGSFEVTGKTNALFFVSHVTQEKEQVPSNEEVKKERVVPAFRKQLSIAVEFVSLSCVLCEKCCCPDTWDELASKIAQSEIRPCVMLRELIWCRISNLVCLPFRRFYSNLTFPWASAIWIIFLREKTLGKHSS